MFKVLTVLLLLPVKRLQISCLLFCHFTEGQQHKKRKKKKQTVLDYCSLEALDTNVSMVLASMTSWGRSLQSLIVLGRNEYCWYWFLQCGCENWLCLHH